MSTNQLIRRLFSRVAGTPALTAKRAAVMLTLMLLMTQAVWAADVVTYTISRIAQEGRYIYSLDGTDGSSQVIIDSKDVSPTSITAQMGDDVTFHVTTPGGSSTITCGANSDERAIIAGFQCYFHSSDGLTYVFTFTSKRRYITHIQIDGIGHKDYKAAKTTMEADNSSKTVTVNWNCGSGGNRNGAPGKFIVTYDHMPNPAHFSVSGDVYTIHTAEGWDYFCDMLADNDKGYFSGKTVRLGADITVTRMAGGQPFTGTFDGGGHTLTLDYGTADAPVDAQFVAPFIETSADGDHQPTFCNLTIDGTIYATHTQATDHDHVGGLIGHLFGTVTIEDCTSLVEIHAKGGAGGFVGLCEHSVSFTNCHSAAVVHSAGGNNSGFVAWSRDSGWNINFTGCLFDGKLLQQNGSGASNGGFVGWKGFSKTVTITNCIAAPAADENMATDNSATFCRYSADTTKDNGETHITNCYYTQTLGNAQGKALHTVTAGTDVTVAHAGVPTHYTPQAASQPTRPRGPVPTATPSSPDSYIIIM